MIEPTKIRIGNYCRDKVSGELLLVDEIVKGESGMHHVGFFVINRDKYPLPKGWEAEYVPLVTHDVLFKCGFDHYHENPRLENFYVNKQSYYPFFIYSTRNVCYMLNENVEIKYLHQLQNLFFALTGEELKIEL